MMKELQLQIPERIANKDSIVLFWFRRDLRLHDNKGLFHALNSGKSVLPVFIFDEHILDPLPQDDHRVNFIYDTLKEMHGELQRSGRGLLVLKGKPEAVMPELLSKYNISCIYCNEDHELYGRERDESIAVLCKKQGVGFYGFLDHLVAGKDHVLTAEGNPYKVFTPYSRAWKTVIGEKHTGNYSSEKFLEAFEETGHLGFPELKDIGFTESAFKAAPLEIKEHLIRNYHETRDVPALDGTSRLGVHLRFGTVSIRELVRKARQWNETFLNELIWREFYAMILWHFSFVDGRAFKPAYDRIEWRNDEREFEAWKAGRTGYPMVDAGMRQINETGYMHNRLRMVVASFLSKHLLIDWRWGEAYFAKKLFDFELSSNNGGWQWSAGTGCDAAPYFRIFNPTTQQSKFDPHGEFVSKWIPELKTGGYPEPIVDHKMARERCLMVYKQALGG